LSLNPINEVKYRYRLASNHFKRAEQLFKLGDWSGAVSSAQLAVENFAKAVISVYEIPTWSHDPSDQLEGVIAKVPSELTSKAVRLASIARTLAPEHGRSSYGEPEKGLTPSDIYRESHAVDALGKAREAKELAEEILRRLCRNQQFQNR